MKLEIETIDTHIVKLNQLLNNDKFMQRAQPGVIAEKKEIMETFKSKKDNLNTFIDSMSK